VIVKKQIYIMPKNHNIMKDKEIWPNFFIVGAAKAGTTSLNMYLTQMNLMLKYIIFMTSMPT